MLSVYALLAIARDPLMSIELLRAMHRSHGGVFLMSLEGKQMSMTEQVNEETKPRPSRAKKALESLLEHDTTVTHQAAIGIALKILDQGHLDALSPEQMDVFERHIAPHVNLTCELCNKRLKIDELARALSVERLQERATCSACE